MGGGGREVVNMDYQILFTMCALGGGHTVRCFSILFGVNTWGGRGYRRARVGWGWSGVCSNSYFTRFIYEYECINVLREAVSLITSYILKWL